jgi:putative hydrolase of the HAD superfamily
LFFKHPPFFLSADTPQLIEEISQVVPLHLLSNTMMICHTTLSKTLHEYLGIGQLFQSMTFSDDAGYSKPHPRIFEECFKSMTCNRSNVMHLGDNQRTDYDGASQFGFRACLLSETKPVRSGIVDFVGSLREFRDTLFSKSNSPT